MSVLSELTPTLKSISDLRERLLMEVMLIAYACISRGGGECAICTGDFVRELREFGFHVEVTDRELVISVTH